jgi:hypothetical protein
VSLDAARAAFPTIPGTTFPAAANALDLVDFGTTFGRHGGILALQPPRVAYHAAALVPATDRDGLDTAGIRAMQVRVPLGTSTGWNVRRAGHRATDLCGLSGSFVPFARTKVERSATGDSRLSLEERYGSHDRFLDAVTKAASALVKARFLLQEDADRFVAAAKAMELP